MPFFFNIIRMRHDESAPQQVAYLRGWSVIVLRNQAYNDIKCYFRVFFFILGFCYICHIFNSYCLITISHI